MPSPRRIGLWVFRLFSILLSALLSVVLLEFGMRLRKLKSLQLGAGIEDPHFHHRLHPNETYHFESAEFNVDIRTNSYGLRGPDDPVIPKPPGTLRILMMGDSYTFGFPVRDEETFCHLIQEGLRAQGLPVEVVNAGVSGYAPTLHYVSLRDQFLEFQPDLVVLWYDLGDIQEDAWFQKNIVSDGQGRILRVDPSYVNGRYDRWGQIVEHSMLAKYINNKLFRTVWKIKELGLIPYLSLAIQGKRSKVAIAEKHRRELSPDLASLDRFLLVRETSTPEMLQPYWALNVKYLTMMRELLAERGIPFVLGVYPYGMVAGPDQWVPGREFWGFEAGRTYSADPALRLFTQFTAGQGMLLLNTFGGFQEAAKTQKLYYGEDGHMTPAGHRVLAEQVVHNPEFLKLVRSRLSTLAK